MDKSWVIAKKQDDFRTISSRWKMKRISMKRFFSCCGVPNLFCTNSSLKRINTELSRSKCINKEYFARFSCAWHVTFDLHSMETCKVKRMAKLSGCSHQVNSFASGLLFWNMTLISPSNWSNASRVEVVGLKTWTTRIVLIYRTKKLTHTPSGFKSRTCTSVSRLDEPSTIQSTAAIRIPLSRSFASSCFAFRSSTA